MTGDEARNSIAKANRMADSGNVDEAIRELGRVILSMVDHMDPDVEAMIENQRADASAPKGKETRRKK